MEHILQRVTYGGAVSNIILILLVCIWIYCILWVAKDISRRTNSFGLQLLSILCIFFLTPVLGLPIYMLLRPIHVDTEQATIRKSGIVCFSCGKINDKAFAYCVYCGETLKIACPTCDKPIGVDYEFCPWCGDHVSSSRA